MRTCGTGRPRKAGCGRCHVPEAMSSWSGDYPVGTRRLNDCSAIITAGLLQSDGYEAYATYVQAHEGVEWLGCWAHARRRFFEAAAERPRTAECVLRLISRLYQLENEWGEANIDAQRAALRQEHFARPLRRLRWLVTALQPRVLPKSGLGSMCLSTGALGATDRASAPQPRPPRHQLGRERDPAEQARREELALRRPS